MVIMTGGRRCRMGGARKGPAKKLPYKVFGKKVVEGHFNLPGGTEGISTVAVRTEWPQDDERYWVAKKAREEALAREAREEANRPVWHYELVYGPRKK